MTKQEFQLLEEHLRERSTNARTKMNRNAYTKLLACCLLIRWTGIRPGEAVRLCWRHVMPKRVTHENGLVERYIRVFIPKEVAKRRRARDIFTTENYGVVRTALTRWRHVCAHDEWFSDKDDDLIFAQLHDPTLPAVFSPFMSQVLHKLGIHTDANGSLLSLYSIRHLYASASIEAGVPIADIALHMGTSIAMIEKTYRSVEAWDVRERLLTDDLHAEDDWHSGDEEDGWS